MKSFRTTAVTCALACLLGTGLCLADVAIAQHEHHADHSGHEHHADHSGHEGHVDHSGHEGHVDHSKHMAQASNPLVISSEAYDEPSITLTNHRGEAVAMDSLFTGDKPVALNFIFATCTTVCPVMSAGFATFENSLGENAADIELLSITIDPEHDNPLVLANYAQRFKAGPGWQFLTGSREDINGVMKAFDAYVANKMSHRPLTFMKAAGATGWTRYEGFMSSADYKRAWEKLGGS